jgi:hypothetical protein
MVSDRSPASRGVVLIVGLAMVVMYAALAAWSGHLSPLARGPLLDGLGPINYRWVNPPPPLASTNQPPAAGSFPLTLAPDGVQGQVVFTADSQATVIVATGSIPAREGEKAVELTVKPLDAGVLGAPPDGLTMFGNAYQIGATYTPTGKKIRELGEPLDVILVYPATSTLHATTHELLYSADGTSWERIDSTDSASQQQAEGNVPGFGYVVVAGVLSTLAPPVDDPTGEGSTTLAIVLLVIAGCILLVGVALLLRSRQT